MCPLFSLTIRGEREAFDSMLSFPRVENDHSRERRSVKPKDIFVSLRDLPGVTTHMRLYVDTQQLWLIRCLDVVGKFAFLAFLDVFRAINSPFVVATKVTLTVSFTIIVKLGSSFLHHPSPTLHVVSFGWEILFIKTIYNP